MRPCLVACIFTVVACCSALAQSLGTECRALSGQLIRVWVDGVSVRHSGSYERVAKGGGVDLSKLDCGVEVHPGLFPVVVKDQTERLLLMKIFGIYYADFINQAEPKVYRGNKRCAVITGDGYVPVDLSEKLISKYAAQGFDFDTLCLAFTAGQLRYDPETGERIPTFVDIMQHGNDAIISHELPFVIPKCLAKSKIHRPEDITAELVLKGCNVKFHPWSGRQLEQWEIEYFRTNPLMFVFGGAGDVLTDTLRLLSDQNRRLTRARIDTISDAIQKYQGRQNK
jgi:hypothetical protein